MENKIRKIIEKADSIALFSHKNPDGDAIWSLLWFGMLLEKMKKKTSYFTPTLPSRIYDFLPNVEKISSEFDYWKYDVLLFLDFSDYSRIQSFYDKNPDYFNNHTIIVIDHHIYTQKHENWNIVTDHTAVSACEVILEYTYKRWPELYDSTIATYLYLGLTTDSGNFRYDEDHKRILKNALQLIELGADKKTVVNNAFRRKSFAWVKMMELMFKRLQKKWDLVYTRYTNKDIEKLWIDREEADFGQVIIQDIEDAKVTVIFREDKNNNVCTMSFRSKNINVQEIAKHYGWWGHIHAAWCSVPRKWRFVKQVDKLATQITKMI